MTESSAGTSTVAQRLGICALNARGTGSGCFLVEELRPHRMPSGEATKNARKHYKHPEEGGIK